MSIGALSRHLKDFVLVHQIELLLFVLLSDVRVDGPDVAAAQETQWNRYITAWFSSITPAWFFTVFNCLAISLEQLDAGTYLKDSNLNFVDWS